MALGACLRLFFAIQSVRNQPTFRIVGSCNRLGPYDIFTPIGAGSWGEVSDSNRRRLAILKESDGFEQQGRGADPVSIFLEFLYDQRPSRFARACCPAGRA
jgi:hypothetical protein